jgi:hypothetical protein
VPRDKVRKGSGRPKSGALHRFTRARRRLPSRPWSSSVRWEISTNLGTYERTGIGVRGWLWEIARDGRCLFAVHVASFRLAWIAVVSGLLMRAVSLPGPTSPGDDSGAAQAKRLCFSPDACICRRRALDSLLTVKADDGVCYPFAPDDFGRGSIPAASIGLVERSMDRDNRRAVK